MSYCVNCGVELDAAAEFCPLCHTPVYNPGRPIDPRTPKPFPTKPSVVPPASKRAVSLLITAMLASMAAACGLLNLFLRPNRAWSLYVIGAAAMLWIWIVPPLLLRKMPLCLKLLFDVCAVAFYLYLIALDLHGSGWFWPLGLPIVCWGGAILLLLGLVFQGGRSVLTTVTLLIGGIGVFLLGVEILVDQFLLGGWTPGWSLVVLTICIALIIPLIVVRRVPSLREEARRRFHM